MDKKIEKILIKSIIIQASGSKDQCQEGGNFTPTIISSDLERITSTRVIVVIRPPNGPSVVASLVNN